MNKNRRLIDDSVSRGGYVIPDDGFMLDGYGDEELGAIWYSAEEFRAARRQLYDVMNIFNRFVSQHWNAVPKSHRDQYKALMNRFGSFFADTANLTDEVLFTTAQVAALRDFQSQFDTLKRAIETAVGQSSGVIAPTTPTDRSGIGEAIIGGATGVGTTTRNLIIMGILAYVAVAFINANSGK